MLRAISVEPFLKWAGGKRTFASVIASHICWKPDSRYFEPFLGAGAVFFALRPQQAVLADANQDLIATFLAVRDNVESVIRTLRRHRYRENDYYRIRASKPTSAHGRAARFIYLNKSCFNGLYRVNKLGEFNVPFGRHGDNPLICDAEQLRSASEALQGTELGVNDFAVTVQSASEGDVVYFDPPYITSHTNNGFAEYNAQIFSWRDQRRLAHSAADLQSRGVHVLISNGNHQSIRRLYSRTGRYTVHVIARHSTMAGSSSSRRPASEILLVGKS